MEIQDLRPDSSVLEKYIKAPNHNKPHWFLTPDTRFVWDEIKREATPQQKRKFQSIRHALIKYLLRDIPKSNFNVQIFGSNSLDSDVDITIIPKKRESASKVYQDVLSKYNNMFHVSMNKMFNLNIYASSFIYYTSPRLNFAVDMTTICASYCKYNMRFITLSSQEIKTHQYKFMTSLMTDPAFKQLKQLIQDKAYINLDFNQIKTRLPIRNHIQAIKKYESIIFNEREGSTIEALDLLCQSTFFVEDAYHTQGTMLHVTCPPIFRRVCYNEIDPCYFVCSFYENIGYAATSPSDKTVKYIERYTEAILILLLRLNQLHVDQSNYQKFKTVFNVYSRAKRLNTLRKENKSIKPMRLNIEQATRWMYDICNKHYKVLFGV